MKIFKNSGWHWPILHNKFSDYLKEIYLKNIALPLVKKEIIYYISKLGNLDRRTYKSKLNNFLKDLNSIRNPVLISYDEYLKIFEYPLEIKDNWKKNILLKVDVKIIDALSGRKLKINYMQIFKCTECTSKKNTDDKCSVCHATGTLKTEERSTICDSCKGYGYHLSYKCPICNNNLVYKKKNSVELILDKDFYEGSIYSYSSLGNYDIFTNQYGSLKIEPVLISDVTRDEKIKLKVVNGSQVESKEKLKLTTMVLGGSHSVSHALGKCVIIIEPGTQPGDYKVVNNIGIPNYFDKMEKEMHKGNQVVFLDLDLPTKDKLEKNEELKKMFKDLKYYDDIEELNKLNKCDITIY